MTMERLRILVVEDNPILRSAYTTKFTLEGFEVDAAADGEEALAKARAREPDLIVLDLLMPRVNGVDFLRAYDLAGAHPGVKVVVFSNTSVPGMMQETLDLGASRVLTKSTVTPKALVAVVREVLAAEEASSG